MSKKPYLLHTAVALLTAIAFIWNQCIWAIGPETLYNYQSDNPQQHVEANKPKYEESLLQNLQKTSLKVFSRFIEVLAKKANFEAKIPFIDTKNPIQTCVTPSGNDRLGRIDEKYGTYDGKKYKWEAISYDELGRPTAYKEKIGKVSQKTYDIVYNELGDIAYAKVKVTVKSGGLIKSKTTVVTEYKYGYDKYGQHEKIWENEIYRKTNTPIIGRIIQAAIAAVTAVFTAGQSLWVTAAWMAASSFASTLIMTGDIRQALLSAAISFITSVIGQHIQNIIAPGAQQAVAQITFENFFKAFVREFIASEVFEFVSARGPPFLAYLASVFVSKLIGAALPIDYIGVLPSTTSELLQKFFSPQALIYDLVSATINQLIDNAIKDGRISAEVGRVLRALSLAFASALIQSAAEKIEAKMEVADLKRQGYQPIYNRDGQIVLWVKTEGNSIIYYNPDGTYNSTDVLDENNNLLYSIEPGPIKGSLTYIDPQGTPIFTTLPDGRIISYDINGNLEGVLAKDALPYWTDTGEFRGSYIEKDIGKEFYDKSGNYEAFILDSFEPVEFAGKIYFQRYKVDENTYIIADQNGQLQGRAIYDYADEGILKGYGWVTEDRTSYYDASGNLVWYRTNEPNSAINFYDSQGNLISQLFTQVDKNGVVEGYLYNSLAQDQFAFMDQNGNVIPRELVSGIFIQDGQTFTILPGTKFLVIDPTTGQIQGSIVFDSGKFILNDINGTNRGEYNLFKAINTTFKKFDYYEYLLAYKISTLLYPEGRPAMGSEIVPSGETGFYVDKKVFSQVYLEAIHSNNDEKSAKDYLSSHHPYYRSVKIETPMEEVLNNSILAVSGLQFGMKAYIKFMQGDITGAIKSLGKDIGKKLSLGVIKELSNTVKEFSALVGFLLNSEKALKVTYAVGDSLNKTAQIINLVDKIYTGKELIAGEVNTFNNLYKIIENLSKATVQDVALLAAKKYFEDEINKPSEFDSKTDKNYFREPVYINSKNNTIYIPLQSYQSSVLNVDILKYLYQDIGFGVDVSYDEVAEVMSQLVSQAMILAKNEWRPMNLTFEPYIRDAMIDIGEGRYKPWRGIDE